MATLPALDPPPLLDEIISARPDERERLLGVWGSPLASGGTTTFVHLGDAEEVAVQHFMAGFPAIPSLQAAGSGVHSVTVALPQRSRVEYKLSVKGHGRTTELLDPFNPHRATDPFGANSVAFGPGYVTPWWATDEPWRRGSVRRGFVEARAFGQRRFLRWYHPVGGGDRLPLLVVHDGRDFIDHAGITHVLDHLINAGVIPPVVAALIDPGHRLAEYTDDGRHAAFVADVVHAAVRRHHADPDPGAHVYLGASLGALAALSAAWRAGPIGGLVLLSGSFVTALGGPMRRGDQFRPVIDFMKRFSKRPGRPAARIFHACGAYEGLAPDHRAFIPLLGSIGADLVSVEVPDGHHWHNWRDRLAAAMRHTLPGGPGSGLGTVRG